MIGGLKTHLASQGDGSHQIISDAWYGQKGFDHVKSYARLCEPKSGSNSMVKRSQALSPRVEKCREADGIALPPGS